ncbi:hypothetical protein MK079_03415, partial [Candidatus Gracilibacteria bacterium]|nr:hypothetical protein [Candidatus Gracilibacteria bacterium]
MILINLSLSIQSYLFQKKGDMQEKPTDKDNSEILEYHIDIGITQKQSCINSFQKQYTQKLHTDFIENKEEKKHNINSHSNWFNKKIKY